MPNQSRPASTSNPSSRRVGRTKGRVATNVPSRMLPIVRRPSASALGENERPAARMPTKAAAQRITETSAAASGSQDLRDVVLVVIPRNLLQVWNSARALWSSHSKEWAQQVTALETQWCAGAFCTAIDPFNAGCFDGRASDLFTHYLVDSSAIDYIERRQHQKHPDERITR